MAQHSKQFKFGWFGDGGFGERVIDKILSGKKTATACLAYELEDADVKVGDTLQLVDKKGRVYGTVAIVDIQIRKFETFDEILAARCGHTLDELRELMKFANERMPDPNEDMRVTFFKTLSINKPAP